METQDRNLKSYQRARKKVLRMKGFYIHLSVFVCVIMLVVLSRLLKKGHFDIAELWSFSFWGLGLLVHGLTVFLPGVIFGSDWEQRKINEIMEKERKLNP